MADQLLPATEPTWIDTILSTYAEGASDVEVCKILKTTMKRFNEKYNEDQKFADLIDYGRLTSHAWWLEQARKAIMDRSFNTPMWVFVMKNRFGWADKTEAINALPDAMTNVDSLRAKMMEMLPSIIKSVNPNATDSQILKDLRSIK